MKVCESEQVTAQMFEASVTFVISQNNDLVNPFLELFNHGDKKCQLKK